MIPFNKPYLHGRELVYIAEAVASGKISGDGIFTKKCHDFFEKRYGFRKVLMTTSCTDALELSALLLNIKEGDEVIVPAFTFVSTANAFALRGAKIIFADSGRDNPNIDTDKLVQLISPRTKAIVVVHYAGVACDMNPIIAAAKQNGISLIEDAAQAIDSYYYDRPLGSLGTFGAFSFHETKNVIAGEGGMLAINDSGNVAQAEIIREKGTNRSAFFRGEVDKYGWVALGSSFLPTDIVSAYLYAQLENLDSIQARRRELWDLYWSRLVTDLPKFGLTLPHVPAWATNNSHMFYVVCKNAAQREALISNLRALGIYAVFHYSALHRSAYYKDKHDGRELPQADRYSDCLVRLPLYYELTNTQVNYICDSLLATLGAGRA